MLIRDTDADMCTLSSWLMHGDYAVMSDMSEELPSIIENCSYVYIQGNVNYREDGCTTFSMIVLDT